MQICRTVISLARAGRVDRMPEALFARFGFGSQDVAWLRERFTAWPVSAYPRSVAKEPGFGAAQTGICSLLALVLMFALVFACDGRVDVITDSR